VSPVEENTHFQNRQIPSTPSRRNSVGDPTFNHRFGVSRFRPLATTSVSTTRRSADAKNAALKLSIDSTITSIPLLPTAEKRQVLQLIDAFIERGQLRSKVQGAQLSSTPVKQSHLEPQRASRPIPRAACQVSTTAPHALHPCYLRSPNRCLKTRRHIRTPHTYAPTNTTPMETKTTPSPSLASAKVVNSEIGRPRVNVAALTKPLLVETSRPKRANTCIHMIIQHPLVFGRFNNGLLGFDGRAGLRA